MRRNLHTRESRYTHRWTSSRSIDARTSDKSVDFCLSLTWLVGQSSGAGGRRQVREQRTHLLREEPGVQVRELAAVKCGQLMHQQARPGRLRAASFRLRIVKQPEIPRVNLAITVLEANAL